jgi:adenosylhomocysteinase
MIKILLIILFIIIIYFTIYFMRIEYMTNESSDKQEEKLVKWTCDNSQVLNIFGQKNIQNQSFKNIKISVNLHLTQETLCLIILLRNAGAILFITPSNRFSTQDSVVKYLKNEKNIIILGKKNESEEELLDHYDKSLKFGAKLIVDDGAELLQYLFNNYSYYVNYTKNLKFSTEQTKTGVIRLKKFQDDGTLNIPIITVNNENLKLLIDSTYGTGQSAVDILTNITNILIAGKICVVVGFGNVGKGIAIRMSAMGTNMVICEIDPIKALDAAFLGFRVMRMDEACKIGDIFLTATGNINVIRKNHFLNMKNNVFLGNLGHQDVEINKYELKNISTKINKNILPLVDEYIVNNKKIYLLADGQPYNLVIGKGNAITSLSNSFCIQLRAIEYGLFNYKDLIPNKMQILPQKIIDEIGKIQLNLLGYNIDKLTFEQIKYLNL